MEIFRNFPVFRTIFPPHITSSSGGSSSSGSGSGSSSSSSSIVQQLTGHLPATLTKLL